MMNNIGWNDYCDFWDGYLNAMQNFNGIHGWSSSWLNEYLKVEISIDED